MNLKIAENDMRFRITPDELGRLLQGQAVTHKTPVGSSVFTVDIRPLASGEMMVLEATGAGIHVSVPHHMLQSLHDIGRSREGVLVNQDGVTVSLQVDLKMGKAA